MYEKKFIPTAEAAKIAGVTSETIRNVAKAGAIAYRMRKHLFIVNREDVEKYVATISDIHSAMTDIEELKQSLISEQAELNEQLEAMRIIYRERMLNMDMFPKRIAVIRDFLLTILSSISRYVEMEDCGISHREWNVLWEALQGKSFEDIGNNMNPPVTKQTANQVWHKGLRKMVLVKGMFEHLKEENNYLKKELQEKNDKIASLHAQPENNLVVDDPTRKLSKLLATYVRDLDISVRAKNCLCAAEIKTVRDLVNYKRSDLLRFRNFGKRSITELEEWLEKHGLQFGMDVDSIPEYVK